ncbi:MAG TPA: primosomal replication protein N [Burkholderiales bacterium]|nr:primosomal replication protein N [Burkholderiales bacterium]
MDRSNRMTLSGQLAARDALRYTPAGVAILGFSVAHQSRQNEAGADRDVGIEMVCVAVEAEAKALAAAPLGIGLKLAGFLAPKGKHSRQLVLHVNEIEFLEGVSDAPTQQRP